ncbi:MAG: metal-sensing transcriptional repressor [Solirubrobacteraceae bacterium]
MQRHVEGPGARRPQRMVDQGRACIDVLTQIAAAQ